MLWCAEIALVFLGVANIIGAAIDDEERLLRLFRTGVAAGCIIGAIGVGRIL